MFVDTAKAELHAGKGGDGAVSFRHEIYIPKGGPDGGDGGRGGSIIFRADKDTNTLLDFRFNPILRAENGKNGAGQRAAGRSGKDLIVEVPVGTVVRKISKQNNTCGDSVEPGRASGSAETPVATAPWDAEGRRPTEVSGACCKSTVLLADLAYDGAEAVIARGGDGGFGNAHFKSSVRQTPKIAEVGEPGEEFEVELELKLLADVGLVGLPNAGKSTFLSVVSNAKPEIADYPFTTVTPNLGVATIDGTDLLIADIPGLIEGASEGKGLGYAFLRHVDRTAVLLHLVDVYNDDAGEAYATIRKELEKYSDLASRPEVVALTKTDGLDREIIEMQTASVLAVNPDAKVYTISSSAHQGLDELLRALKIEVDAGKSDESGEAEKLTPSGSCSSLSVDGCGHPTPTARDAQVSRDASASHSLEDVSFSASPVIRAPSDSVKGAIPSSDLPVVQLDPRALKDVWTAEKQGDKFVVKGEKIEKFARRTDLSNYASVNRLRDIMKKMGIRGELTSLGAEPESIIEIAGKEFTFVEQGWD